MWLGISDTNQENYQNKNEKQISVNVSKSGTNTLFKTLFGRGSIDSHDSR